MVAVMPWRRNYPCLCWGFVPPPRAENIRPMSMSRSQWARGAPSSDSGPISAAKTVLDCACIWNSVARATWVALRKRIMIRHCTYPIPDLFQFYLKFFGTTLARTNSFDHAEQKLYKFDVHIRAVTFVRTHSGLDYNNDKQIKNWLHLNVLKKLLTDSKM